MFPTMLKPGEIPMLVKVTVRFMGTSFLPKKTSDNTSRIEEGSRQTRIKLSYVTLDRFSPVTPLSCSSYATSWHHQSTTLFFIVLIQRPLVAEVLQCVFKGALWRFWNPVTSFGLSTNDIVLQSAYKWPIKRWPMYLNCYTEPLRARFLSIYL